MPLPSSVLGLTGEPIHHRVDLRWLLSYSAGIGDTSSAAFGPDATAHPMFIVGPEWPAVLSVRRLGLEPGEDTRGVHASHDVTIHRPVRAGDELTTTATIVGVEAGRAGAATWLRLATVDAAGEAVATTYQRNVLLGVELRGDPASIDQAPPIPEPAQAADDRTCAPDVRTVDVTIGPQEAHIYTECSRIWNPIHTEWQAAADNWLAFLLLHGTATLAKSVSAVDDCGVTDGGGLAASSAGSRRRFRCRQHCASPRHPMDRSPPRCPMGRQRSASGRVFWRPE